MEHIKSYFFNSPPTEAGDKFSKKNIPTEATYRDLLDSVPFFLEKDDEATVSQRGIVRVYNNDGAIKEHNKISSERRVVESSQMTSIGVLLNGLYIESSHTLAPPYLGSPVSAGGIRSRAMVHEAGDIKRLSYSNELDISTYADLPKMPLDTNNLKLVCLDVTTGMHYLLGLSDLIGAKGDVDDISYTHTQDTESDTWIVEHNLGYKPAVSVLITGDDDISEAVEEHESVNRLLIKFSMPQTGKAFLT